MMIKVRPHLALDQVLGHSSLGPLGEDYPISFDLISGKVGVIFGGKKTSSLFRLILGSGVLKNGQIKLFDRLVRSANQTVDIAVWRQQIGFGFREKGLLSNLSIIENVDLPARYHGFYSKWIPHQLHAEHALAESGVDPSTWFLRPSSINWEIRKRALLARAIVLRPQIIILDDPSALIASTALPELIRWIRRQTAKGRAVLCGTNDFPFGLAIADWVLDPRSNTPSTKFREFIDPIWLESAALLKTLTEEKKI